MKIQLIILCLFISHGAFAQQTASVRGALVDSAQNAVAGSVVVLMNRADSTHVKWENCDGNTFELEYEGGGAGKLLYVSAIGYNSRYLEVDESRSDLGNIVMTPWSMDLDQVTVSARKPIEHKFEHGRDEYTIPEWLGEREYDLTSLLSLIPGLSLINGGIQIAGIGNPTFLINGLNPRIGELENLNPKDIEKVTIIRMPTGKFDQSVLGIISIHTRKSWHDYFSVRLNNGFKYTNVVNNNSSVSVNYRKDKFTHFLNYTYSYDQQKHSMLFNYETIIPEEEIHYSMLSVSNTHEKRSAHTMIYSPKYQINDQSFIDVQYFFSDVNTSGNYQTVTENSDTIPDLLSHSLLNDDQKTHNVVLRYDNSFDEKHRLTFNTIYASVKDSRDNNLTEQSILSGQPSEETNTVYYQVYRNEALSSSLDFKFTLWGAMEMEAGVSYANIWTRSNMAYYTQDTKWDSRTRNEQAVAYWGADCGFGKFHYQIGLRAQYEYLHGTGGSKTQENSFYFLPSVGVSCHINNDLNFMLYYRRTVRYPTVSQLNSNISYVHKYLYFTGNPLLKQTVSNSFTARAALPLGLALTTRYSHNKNEILQQAINNEEDPNIIVVTFENLKKTNSLDLTLSWLKVFKAYYINMNVGYSQTFMNTRFINDDVKFNKPAFSTDMTHNFTISSYMSASIYMNYKGAYNYNIYYIKETYSLSAQLQFSLIKRRMNIRISGDNLLNSGDHYQRGEHKQVISRNRNSYHSRGVSVGVSYNFNNFLDMFRKNESGNEIINRIQ